MTCNFLWSTRLYVKSYRFRLTGALSPPPVGNPQGAALLATRQLAGAARVLVHQTALCDYRRATPFRLLKVRVDSNRRELLNRSGTVVGQLAGGFETRVGMRCMFATVLAIATWDHECSEPQFRDRLHCDTWEVVVPELVFEPDS